MHGIFESSVHVVDSSASVKSLVSKEQASSAKEMFDKHDVHFAEDVVIHSVENNLEYPRGYVSLF